LRIAHTPCYPRWLLGKLKAKCVATFPRPSFARGKAVSIFLFFVLLFSWLTTRRKKKTETKPMQSRLAGLVGGVFF